jgi:hypothetical protein
VLTVLGQSSDFRCQILRNEAIKPLARSWPQRLDRAYLICYKELMTGTEGTLGEWFAAWSWSTR